MASWVSDAVVMWVINFENLMKANIGINIITTKLRLLSTDDRFLNRNHNNRCTKTENWKPEYN